MKRREQLALSWLVCLLAALPGTAGADEGGASFWLPGQYGSFAAVPGDPGWSLPIVYYHAEASAGGDKSFIRGGHVVAGIDNRIDLVYLTPTYTLARPVAGAQAALSLSWAFGGTTTGVSATLTGPGGGAATGERSDDVVGGSDVAPQVSLKWSKGAHNGMAYVTVNVPVGSYESDRLSNLGLNEWAWDFGGAYTYVDSASGRELSTTLGLTRNGVNEATEYENGLDGHLDWALSRTFARLGYVGVVGYVYQQLTGDSGSGARLGPFKSSAVGLGPELGGDLSLGGQALSAEIKAYWDLDTENRVPGWSLWVSTSVPFGPGGGP